MIDIAEIDIDDLVGIVAGELICTKDEVRRAPSLGKLAQKLYPERLAPGFGVYGDLYWVGVIMVLEDTYDFGIPDEEIDRLFFGDLSRVKAYIESRT